MQIDGEDFKSFFDVAFDVQEVSDLKCYQCGQRLKEKEDLSGLTCTNNHDVGYLEYMATYSGMLKDVFDNAVFSIELQRKALKPSQVVFSGNDILLIDNRIVRI